MLDFIIKHARYLINVSHFSKLCMKESLINSVFIKKFFQKRLFWNGRSQNYLQNSTPMYTGCPVTDRGILVLQKNGQF